MLEKDKEGDYTKEQILIIFELFRNIGKKKKKIWFFLTSNSRLCLGVFRNVKESKKPFDPKEVYRFTHVIETIDGLQNVIITNYEDILQIRKQLTNELSLQEFYADFMDEIDNFSTNEINNPDILKGGGGGGEIEDKKGYFKASNAIEFISKKYKISKQASIYVGKIFLKYKIFIGKDLQQKTVKNGPNSYFKLIEFMDFCDNLNEIIKRIKKEEENFGIFYFDFDITEEERNKMKDTQQFEIEPEIVMKRDSEKGKLPHPFLEMLEYLKSKNIENFEGIFRISGYAEEINDFRFRYDFGEKVNLNELTNPHTVATLFKTYLKIMPTPVLTFELYNDLLDLTEIEDEQKKLSDLINLLNTLSIERKLMLIEIIKLMKIIVKNKDVNKMTNDNLATVIGVNIIRSKETKSNPMILMQDQKRIQALFGILIDYFSNYIEYLNLEE